MRKHPIALELALATALLLLSARAAPAAITLSPPMEVTTSPSVGAYDAGSLAVLEDGSFAIGRRADSHRFEILFFRPDGTSLGEPVELATTTSAGAPFGGVGPFGDRYFVTWEVYGSGRAHAAFFSREGEALGSAFSWPYSDTIYPHWFFHYARGPQGRVLPFFYFQSGKDRLGYPTYAAWSRVFGPRAKFLGRPTELLTERHFLGAEDAALNEDGRFVVSLLRCPRNPRSRQPCIRGLQVFDGAWRPRSPLRSQAVPPAHWRVKHATLALARTGDHLLVWVEHLGDFPNHEERLFARIFRRDGSPTERVLRLNGSGIYGVGPPRVRATHDRTFVIASAESLDGFRGESYLHEVDGRTGKLRESLLIAGDRSNPYAFEFEMNSSGRGVVWYGDHLRLVTVEPDVETEGEAAETIEAVVAGETDLGEGDPHD
jgi:hypothetical protein